MDAELTMRLAAPADAARVMEVLEDGKRSIARFGIEQWQHGYPDLASVEQDIERGVCHVACDADGEIVGSLALIFGVDPEYSRATAVPWLTSNDADAPAYYAAIHRCATAACALKRGVMAFMFAEAARIARERGAESIRIDTHPGNRAMRSFLAKQGFTELGPFELVMKGDSEPDLGRIAYEKLL